MKITAYGKPVTQGSKIRTRWAMRDANGDTLAPWRDNVRAAAIGVMRRKNSSGLIVVDSFGTSPVHVVLTFTFARPASHFGTGRNVAMVKPSALPHPSSHAIGDIDKLTRACLDALTDAGIWADDSQVVGLVARKVWLGSPIAMDRPGVVINILAAS